MGEDMIAADNPPVVTMYSHRLGHEVTLGVGICFEVAYDSIFFDAVRRGAQVLIIPTNNASFGSTPQSTQQLQMTQMQAITTGRAAVQVSTMGVSGVFTPDGRLVARTGLWRQDSVSAAVPLRTSITPAVAMGMVPSYLFAAAAVLLPALGLFSRRRDSATKSQKVGTTVPQNDRTISPQISHRHFARESQNLSHNDEGEAQG
jgi:apolipoprotein N-acyltransferase